MLLLYKKVEIQRSDIISPGGRKASSIAKTYPAIKHKKSRVHTYLQDVAHKFFAYPRFVNQSAENERIFSLLFGGTIIVTSLLFMLLIADYLLYSDIHAPNRLIVSGFAVAAVGGIYILWRRQMYWLTARLLVIFYALMAITITSIWGTGTPFGILLLGLVIVLAGILLGARYAFRTAIISSLVLFLVQIAANNGVYISHILFSTPQSGLGDVFSYTLLFLMIALVAWLFSKQSDYALQKAHRAELSLIEEKELLAIRVKERTLELQATQVEEMQNLYRFAELGQLSTALLHDLANHLTVLTLDLEDLHNSQYATTVKRARRSIRYLDKMVQQTRAQIEGVNSIKRFNIATKTADMAKLMKEKALDKNIAIKVSKIADKSPYRFTGDMIRFNQIITVLIVNAIDAYEDTEVKDKKTIDVSLSNNSDFIRIQIDDWGKGIPEEKAAEIFQPFYTTKKQGMGIGLFIAKRMTEVHLKGTLSLDTSVNHTRFVLTLPRNK